ARHLEPPQRVAGDGPAQEARPCSLTHAVSHRLLHRATGPVHVLTDVEQHYGHPAILADRHARGGCQLVVANELLERVLAEWGSLACCALAQRVEHVGWDLAVDLRQETRNLVAQPGDIELADSHLCCRRCQTPSQASHGSTISR